MLAARNRKIADNVERVTAAGSPSGHNRDHNFRHEANQSLNFENVQPTDASGSRTKRLSALFVLVSGATANALVSA